MPAAVPSIWVSMDERINNLFSDAAQKDRIIPTEAPDLEQTDRRCCRPAEKGWGYGGGEKYRGAGGASYGTDESRVHG